MSDRELLTRREVVRRALAGAGATLFLGSTALINAACAERTERNERNEAAVDLPLFSASEIAWLDEVAETILPQTDTPGAKAAEVGAFIALMVTDCFSPVDQQHLAAAPQQRLVLLERIDQQRYDQAVQMEQAETAPHYFHAIKELTVLGYFTSEIGYNQALRYIETPGRFDPCVEYEAGEPMWARHA
jgi:hypothetical protein